MSEESRDTIAELKESASQLIDALELGMFKRVTLNTSNGSICKCAGSPLAQVDRIVISQRGDRVFVDVRILEAGASKLEDWKLEELDWITSYEPRGLFLDPNDAKLRYLAKKLHEAKALQAKAADSLKKENANVQKLTEAILELEKCIDGRKEGKPES